MNNLHILYKSHSYIKIECDPGIAMELYDYFSFRPQGYQFNPKFKARLWDGYIHLFQLGSYQIYRGLVDKVKEWASNRYYTVTEELPPWENNVSSEAIENFLKALKPKHKPRDYQLDGFLKAIRSKRAVILSPTSSGKSLIQYMLSMYLMREGRGLIVVPRTQLVEQMFSDFQDYSSLNGKDMYKYCWKVYSGKDKNSQHPIIISTWQSLQNLPKEYFAQFDYVIVDEVHSAQAKALSTIISNCVNAEYRIGLTGTLSGSKIHELVIEGLFGKVYKTITSKELMDRKEIAQLSIKCLLLQYGEHEGRVMKSATYKEEIEYLISHKERNRFICNLTLSLKGNTLLLFNYVEKHGKILYDMINSKGKRKVFYIHGKTDVEDRELMRKIIEKEDNAIIVASVGVISTGTNIVNLHNVIFAHPSKSKIRSLQSVGRVLRKSEIKTQATLYDIADDLSYKKHENYSLGHFFERLKIYAAEQFTFKIYKIEI